MEIRINSRKKLIFASSYQGSVNIMKILINAANVRFGGGVTVAKNIIKSIVAKKEFAEIVLLLPQNAGYDFDGEPQVQCIYIPDKFHSDYLFKAVFVRSGFAKMVDNIQPDVVFSLGNVAFPCNKPHLLLIQNAYLFYPESVLWKRLPFKFKLYVKFANLQTKTYLKKATHYMVQTAVMKERLHRLFKVSNDKIEVLPNVVSYQSKDIDRSKNVLPLKDSTTIKLLFLSKFYAHKNYDILIPVAKLIKKRNLPFKIHLTLDTAENLSLAEQIEVQGLSEIIRFIGNILPHQMNEVFEQHDGVFLPTLLESFSGTYIESMFYGRPVFTSDMDFAHIVCKDAGYYFNPLDAQNIVDTFVKAYENTAQMQSKIDEGYRIIESMPTWEDLSVSILTAIAKMTSNHNI